MSQGIVSKSRSKAPLVVAVATGAILGVGWWALASSPEERGAQTFAEMASTPILERAPGAPPLTGGTETSLAGAADRAGYAIARPDHSLAADASLSGVWVVADTGEVALAYESGVVAYLSEWPDRSAWSSPADFYEQQVKDSGVGYVTSIGGNPALVIPKDAQGPGFPPRTVVDISVGRVEVSIWGDMSDAELISVAASVK